MGAQFGSMKNIDGIPSTPHRLALILALGMMDYRGITEISDY